MSYREPRSVVVSLCLSLSRRDPPATVGFRKEPARATLYRTTTTTHCSEDYTAPLSLRFPLLSLRRSETPFVFLPEKKEEIVSLAASLRAGLQLQQPRKEKKNERDERIVGIAFDIQMSISGSVFR